MQITNEELKLAWGRIDTNGDGSISLSEMQDWWSQVPSSPSLVPLPLPAAVAGDSLGSAVLQPVAFLRSDSSRLCGLTLPPQLFTSADPCYVCCRARAIASRAW